MHQVTISRPFCIGKYEVIRRLAVGGMGEIFLAKLGEIEGFEKLVVIKRILDTLAKDDVGAVFAYLRRRLHYRLHCIIDTAGKSLHAWFDAPRTKVLENRLKAGLVAFDGDETVVGKASIVGIARLIPGAPGEAGADH